MSDLTPDPMPDAAEQARARARNAGAKGSKKKLTAAQAALRDTAIIVSLNAGMEERAVAKEFEVTPRTVYRIREASRAQRSPLESAPMEVIEGLLRAYEGQIVRLSRVAFEALSGGSPSAAVAAIRAENEIVNQQTRLLADLGKLPSNLALFREMAELDRVGEVVIDRLAQVARGEVPAGDALRLVREDLSVQFGIAGGERDG